MKSQTIYPTGGSRHGDNMQKNTPFASIARATLATTRIGDLLQSGAAVVLERIARGGGAVNWYYCGGRKELTAIEERLSPGSVVSFFFDGRMRRSRLSSELRRELEEVVASAGEVVVGTLGRDGINIDAALAVSRDDLGELLSDVDPSAEVFCGAFPGRDNDGRYAVTVSLPDNDGIVRPHPH
jgi:hypothetical protein